MSGTFSPQQLLQAHHSSRAGRTAWLRAAAPAAHLQSDAFRRLAHQIRQQVP